MSCLFSFWTKCILGMCVRFISEELLSKPWRLLLGTYQSILFNLLCLLLRAYFIIFELSGFCPSSQFYVPNKLWRFQFLYVSASNILLWEYCHIAPDSMTELTPHSSPHIIFVFSCTSSMIEVSVVNKKQLLWFVRRYPGLAGVVLQNSDFNLAPTRSYMVPFAVRCCVLVSIFLSDPSQRQNHIARYFLSGVSLGGLLSGRKEVRVLTAEYEGATALFTQATQTTEDVNPLPLCRVSMVHNSKLERHKQGLSVCPGRTHCPYLGLRLWGGGKGLNNFQPKQKSLLVKFGRKMQDTPSVPGLLKSNTDCKLAKFPKTCMVFPCPDSAFSEREVGNCAEDVKTVKKTVKCH